MTTGTITTEIAMMTDGKVTMIIDTVIMTTDPSEVIGGVAGVTGETTETTDRRTVLQTHILFAKILFLFF